MSCVFPLPLCFIHCSRNNTKPKQESQFDFKPPQAAQVRSAFLIALFTTDCCFQPAEGLCSNVSLENSYWEAALPQSVCWDLLISFLVCIAVVSSDKHFQCILIKTLIIKKKANISTTVIIDVLCLCFFFFVEEYVLRGLSTKYCCVQMIKSENKKSKT